MAVSDSNHRPGTVHVKENSVVFFFKWSVIGERHKRVKQHIDGTQYGQISAQEHIASDLTEV